jgi:hypothetical protein
VAVEHRVDHDRKSGSHFRLNLDHHEPILHGRSATPKSKDCRMILPLRIQGVNVMITIFAHFRKK